MNLGVVYFNTINGYHPSCFFYETFSDTNAFSQYAVCKIDFHLMQATWRIDLNEPQRDVRSIKYVLSKKTGRLWTHTGNVPWRKVGTSLEPELLDHRYMMYLKSISGHSLEVLKKV